MKYFHASKDITYNNLDKFAVSFILHVIKGCRLGIFPSKLFNRNTR